MPSLMTKRGKQRYRGTVWVQGVRGPTKWFPDASKQSYRDAIEWENKEREKLRRNLNSIHTESSTIRQWVNQYMDHVISHNFSAKTIDEKKSAFQRFVGFYQVRPEMEIAAVERFLCAEFFGEQMVSRTGNSVNKDRKNLGAAWQWGSEYMRGWPKNTENPFLSVSKKPEERHPRYVPPEEDFWAVYDHINRLAVESGEDFAVQDRVMLLAYLHLAARRSELFKATWSDVDFPAGQIRLWTKKREGGTKEFDWLPMTKELAEELKAWSKRRMAQEGVNKTHLFVCLDTRPFCVDYYGQPFTVRQHVMRRWCERAGVNPFGWHAIRHLTASMLYRLGYPQGVIQAILRHRSPSTTARYMRSIGLDEVRAVLDDGLKRGSNVIPFDQMKKASGRRS